MADDYDRVDRLVDTDPIELGRQFRTALAELEHVKERVILAESVLCVLLASELIGTYGHARPTNPMYRVVTPCDRPISVELSEEQIELLHKLVKVI